MLGCRQATSPLRLVQGVQGDLLIYPRECRSPLYCFLILLCSLTLPPIPPQQSHAGDSIHYWQWEPAGAKTWGDDPSSPVQLCLQEGITNSHCIFLSALHPVGPGCRQWQKWLEIEGIKVPERSQGGKNSESDFIKLFMYLWVHC